MRQPETPIAQVLAASFPWCSGWAEELKALFAAYVEAKQRQNVLDYDDLLLYWAQTMNDKALADDIGGEPRRPGQQQRVLTIWCRRHLQRGRNLHDQCQPSRQRDLQPGRAGAAVHHGHHSGQSIAGSV